MFFVPGADRRDRHPGARRDPCDCRLAAGRCAADAETLKEQPITDTNTRTDTTIRIHMAVQTITKNAVTTIPTEPRAITTTHIPTPTQTRTRLPATTTATTTAGRRGGTWCWRFPCSCISSVCRAKGLSTIQIDKTTSMGALQSPKRDAMAMLVGGPALTKVLRKPDPRRMRLKFKELTEAAAMPARHEIYEGDIGIIRGQFVPLTPAATSSSPCSAWT